MFVILYMKLMWSTLQNNSIFIVIIIHNNFIVPIHMFTSPVVLEIALLCLFCKKYSRNHLVRGWDEKVRVWKEEEIKYCPFMTCEVLSLVGRQTSSIRVTTDHARKCYTNTQITKQFCYWVKFHQTHRACQSSFTALAPANAQTKFHCSQRAVPPRSQTHRSVRLSRNPHLTLFRQRESLYGTYKMAAWELSKWIVTSNAYLRNFERFIQLGERKVPHL